MGARGASKVILGLIAAVLFLTAIITVVVAVRNSRAENVRREAAASLARDGGKKLSFKFFPGERYSIATVPKWSADQGDREWFFFAPGGGYFRLYFYKAQYQYKDLEEMPGAKVEQSGLYVLWRTKFVAFIPEADVAVEWSKLSDEEIREMNLMLTTLKIYR